MSLTKLIEVSIVSSQINFPEHLKMHSLGDDEVIIQMSRLFSEAHREENAHTSTIGGDSIDTLAFTIGHHYLEGIVGFFIERGEIALLNSLRLPKAASSANIDSLKNIFSNHTGVLLYEGQEVANIVPTADLSFILNCDETIHEFLNDNITILNQYVIHLGEYTRKIMSVEPQIRAVKRSLAKLLSGEEVYQPILSDYTILDYRSLEEYQRVKIGLGESMRTGELIEAPVVGFTKRGKNENSLMSKAPYFNVTIDNMTIRVIIPKDEEYNTQLSRQSLGSMPINALVRVELTDVSNPSMVKASLKGIVYSK